MGRDTLPPGAPGMPGGALSSGDAATRRRGGGPLLFGGMKTADRIGAANPAARAGAGFHRRGNRSLPHNHSPSAATAANSSDDNDGASIDAAASSMARASGAMARIVPIETTFSRDFQSNFRTNFQNPRGAMRLRRAAQGPGIRFDGPACAARRVPREIREVRVKGLKRATAIRYGRRPRPARQFPLWRYRRAGLTMCSVYAKAEGSTSRIRPGAADRPPDPELRPRCEAVCGRVDQADGEGRRRFRQVAPDRPTGGAARAVTRIRLTSTTRTRGSTCGGCTICSGRWGEAAAAGPPSALRQLHTSQIKSGPTQRPSDHLTSSRGRIGTRARLCPPEVRSVRRGNIGNLLIRSHAGHPPPLTMCYFPKCVLRGGA